MTIKLEDDLVGGRLSQQRLRRTSNEQLVSFEWECLELVREIYAAGVRSFIRAVGISDQLLATLTRARSEIDTPSLGGFGAKEHGGSPQFEGMFLIGVALGSQICTSDPGLLADIEKWESASELAGPFSVRMVDGEISSGLHEGAATPIGVPLVKPDPSFEGDAYPDAKSQLDALFGEEQLRERHLVATPPGFSPTGLLNIAQVVLGAPEPGPGFFESSPEEACTAGHMILSREWLAAGIWMGLWVRARQLALDVEGELSGVSGYETADDLHVQSQGVYELVCGWEYEQGNASTLAWARRQREAVRMPPLRGQANEEDWLKADYFLGRLWVQLSIYSCQATGDFSWWPVYSFLRKGDIVLIRLAPFPRISRNEMDEWYSNSFGQIVLEGGQTFLSDEQPPLLGLERSWSEDNLQEHAEDLWRNVPYLRWLIPEESEEGAVNDGLDGLGVVTSDAVWVDGSWRATIGMVRPFVRSVRYEDISKTTSTVRVPLFPPSRSEVEDDFATSALTMLTNIQFIPDRVELGDQDLSSILRVASGSNIGGGVLALGTPGGAASFDKGGLEESPQDLVTDFERLKLVRENLRLGRSIEEMGDICPWPVKGTWLEGSVKSLFPGRLKLKQQPTLASYPLWVLDRGLNSVTPTWRTSGTPELDETAQFVPCLPKAAERFKGDHPGVGAKHLLETLVELLGYPGRADQPVALLLAVPSKGLVDPLREALAMVARTGGFSLPKADSREAEIVLRAEEVAEGSHVPTALRKAFWRVDPEGVWSRPGSEWQLELHKGDASSSQVSLRMYVLGTKDRTSVIDIESVSAQIARDVVEREA